MYTVVLAGGFGTRLQPVLKGLPKPLAPVKNQCFLEYLLGNLKRNGLYDYIFCLYYMAEKVIALFGDGNELGVRISYSLEEIPLGTAGAIELLRGRLKESFFVINADTYLELNVQDCIAGHKRSKAIATLAVTRVFDPGRYGRVLLDPEGFVRGFSEKSEGMPQDGYINAGFYVFEPEIFDYIPENRFVSLEKEVFPALLENGKKISGYSKVTNFFDIGIPSDYDRFRQWISDVRI